MERRYPFSSEQSYVSQTLNELPGLLRDMQPSHTYSGDWYAAIQLRNSVHRVIRDYEQACNQGYPWAEQLVPNKLFANWEQLVQISEDVDNRRFTFIQCCDKAINYLGYLSNQFEVINPGFSSELRTKIKNIEQLRDQYVDPLTYQKPINRNR